MVRYIARRLGQAVIVALGVVLVTFVLTRVIPGDPAITFAGIHATPQQLADVRRHLGLDKPLSEQLARYIGQLLRGDLGTSVVTRHPVAQDLRSVVPASLELSVTAMVIALVAGLITGVLSARYCRRWPDVGLRLGSMLSISIPTFVLALTMQQVFGTGLHWLPVAGEYAQSLTYTSPLRAYTHVTLIDALLQGDFPVFTSTLQHLVLPALTMASYPAAVICQMTRAALIEEMSQDHVRFERSLGFGERSILTRLALRPSASPVVAVVALVFAYALVNSFLIEEIFNWPGLGQYTVKAIQGDDTAAIAGVTLIVAFVYILLNLAVDVVQRALDPRVAKT
ncbi:MAG TPA: ABC transporter permease [Streptosporangiaceae bacterium]|jgi:peptide/nickel transport system permease protein